MNIVATLHSSFVILLCFSFMIGKFSQSFKRLSVNFADSKFSTENKMTRKPFFPILVIFFVIALLCIVLKYAVKEFSNLFDVLFFANLILYAATAISFRFNSKAINAANTQAFIRMVYSGMILKMLICIVAVLVYAFAFKPVEKAAILIFFGLYFLYTFAEVRIVMRLNKEKKNA